MSRFLDLLNEKQLTLVAEVGEWSLPFAKDGVAAGADAFIVSYFDGCEKILEDILIPCGISFDSKIDKKDLQKYKDIAEKFDFLAVGLKDVKLFSKVNIAKIANLNDKFNIDQLVSITEKEVQGINAAIIPSSQEGKDLLIGDLQNYIAIAISSNLPVIIPTQKNIKASEIPIIWDTGAKGLFVTIKGLTGDSASDFTKKIKEYKKAISAIDVDA